MLVLPFDPAQKIVFELTPLAVGHADTVDLERTLHEVAVADIPREFPVIAPDGHIRWSADVHLVAFVEHVLLKLFPVFVPVRQHLAMNASRSVP